MQAMLGNRGRRLHRITDMRYFEDFEAGQTFELGERSIDEAEIVRFAREFDPQPFHVDPQAAKGSIYGGLIASGWHTGAILMRLVVDGLINDAASLGSTGIDEVRWHQPVRPGDQLRAKVIVMETWPSKQRPERGTVRWRFEVLNQVGNLVMSLQAYNHFGRRPGATGERSTVQETA